MIMNDILRAYPVLNPDQQPALHYNDFANTIPIDQAIQINASIRYALTNQFEVYLCCENLTNTRSSQFYSTDMPGVAA